MAAGPSPTWVVTISPSKPGIICRSHNVLYSNSSLCLSGDICVRIEESCSLHWHYTRQEEAQGSRQRALLAFENPCLSLNETPLFSPPVQFGCPKALCFR